MFETLAARTQQGPYLRNDQGIRRFAEHALSDHVRRVRAKSRRDREVTESQLVEKANRRRYLADLEGQPRLEAGAFFSVRRRLWTETAVSVACLGASLILAFVAVDGLLRQTSAVPGVLQWVVAGVFALVLTGGGLVVTERLVEAIFGAPARPDADVDVSSAEAAGSAPRGVGVLWGLLIVAIELAIFGLAEPQAAAFARTTGSWALYAGFLALALLLPVVAGAVRWDGMRFVDAYKTTLAYQEQDRALAQIDSALRQSEEFENNFYAVELTKTWNAITAFRTVKENRDARKGLQENLAGHFAQSFDLFRAEAARRYDAELHDGGAPALRRLDAPGEPAAAGHKLGQAADEDTPYLAPQPVR